jgi:hypothetical protein
VSVDWRSDRRFEGTECLHLRSQAVIVLEHTTMLLRNVDKYLNVGTAQIPEDLHCQYCCEDLKSRIRRTHTLKLSNA